MQAKHERRCSLCLVSEKEIAPFLEEMKKEHPAVTVNVVPGIGSVEIILTSDETVDPIVESLRKKFPTFFYGEGRVEEAVHAEFIARKKSLALAESCTGGAMAALLTSIPDASLYFLGSIVAYSNSWKERFLQVSRSTLTQKGAVSKETVVEMVKGLFQETDADYAVAISGIAGPGGGTKEKPVGTIYVAIGQKGGRIDAGVIHTTPERKGAIDISVQICLGALWRRIAHNTMTFS
jgi:PncC family amidohydrolase